MPTYERLDYGSPDGSQWGGTSTDKIGHYGVTPVTQYTLVPAASTFVVTSAAQTSFGFTTAESFTTFVFTVSTMNAAGRALGLWA